MHTKPSSSNDSVSRRGAFIQLSESEHRDPRLHDVGRHQRLVRDQKRHNSPRGNVVGVDPEKVKNLTNVRADPIRSVDVLVDIAALPLTPDEDGADLLAHLERRPRQAQILCLQCDDHVACAVGTEDIDIPEISAISSY